MEQKHIHSFKEWQVRPIKIIDNPEYHGTAGDRAWLVTKCTGCSKVHPEDYGFTNDMNDKLWQIASKINGSD